ncbi:MAG: hypothetical protein IT440_16410, partial [Phycisphaeraceae bacterium]|nr:hypothetical protein [Phycisphaeraceae bacterium]
YLSQYFSCTIVDNRGGTAGCLDSAAYSSIVFGNTDDEGNTSNWSFVREPERMFYCCTVPLPSDGTNIATNPQFVGGAHGYRLKYSSPCVDAGQNGGWMLDGTDLDGQARIFNAKTDIGAYEFTMNTRVRCLLQGGYRQAPGLRGVQSTAGGSTGQDSPYAADRRRAEVDPSNTTDWVLLELLETNHMSVIATKSALVHTDGVVVNTGNGDDVRLECRPGFYYLVTKHRNHLASMTPEPLAYTNEIVTYDFTTGPEKYHGGTNACVELEPGVWGLIAGDADGDGKITDVDREIVKRQMGKTGYLSGDINLDGVVSGEDAP